MTKSLSITKAREKLMDLPESFSRESHVEAITVMRRGTPVLAILPWEFYDSLIETMEILSDEDLMQSLRKSIHQAKQGKLIPWERIKKNLHT